MCGGMLIEGGNSKRGRDKRALLQIINGLLAYDNENSIISIYKDFGQFSEYLYMGNMKLWFRRHEDAVELHMYLFRLFIYSSVPDDSPWFTRNLREYIYLNDMLTPSQTQALREDMARHGLTPRMHLDNQDLDGQMVLF